MSSANEMAGSSASSAPSTEYIEHDAPWWSPEWVAAKHDFPLSPSARAEMFGGGA